ncbi:hypothetical protein D3C76_1669800 [compost metagenome]
MLVAQQHLIGKTAAVRVDQGNLASPLAGKEVTRGFRGKGMVVLDTIDVVGFHAIHQDDVLLIDMQRKTGADNQNVIA